MLFCDIVGFTPLSESADPEAVRELLSSYFAVARTVIGRYGGVVEKFIGDAVMAVWGTPTAQEGDAERAVRAALDLVAEVTELGNASGVAGLAARAGVVTGEVAVTLGAVGEGMVAGDAVNTAARIQSAAEAGSVLVDGATRRLASSTIGFADAGEHLLKGKTEQVRLWRATWIMSAFGGAYRMDGLAGPMVGRDPELRTIKELFHATVDRRSARLVLVSGPAGVGKSRLGWEFEKYVDGLAETVQWHRGQCLSYGNGVAFWALGQMVRQRLSIAESDPGEVAAASLADRLDRLISDPAERRFVAARLGRLLGLPIPGDDGGPLAQEELFAGWRLFFERLAAEHPVVLFVEDAQHADAGLLDFLEYLVDWVRGFPLFVLVMARPELALDRPGFGAGRNRITLTLDSLDAASMDALVEALVPGMPTDARLAVANHAQGLPLFAVETVRSLIDRDVVQPVNGAYRLVGPVGDLAVPETLHALLAARLDALDPAAHHLISAAAVLGTTFTAEALAVVSGRDEASVLGGLAELVRRDVLTISADPLSPERGSYQFTHQMLRQVAHDTMSRRDRKARHLAVAAHLRVSFASDGEEVAEVVASHYIDAMNAVPGDPDAADIRAEAIGSLIRAAERAERTGAPASAAISFVTAAELTNSHHADPISRCPSGQASLSAGDLWERAALAALTSGAPTAAMAHAERARSWNLAVGEARLAARAELLMGRALHRLGHLSKARELLTAAADYLRADPDVDTVEAIRTLADLEIVAGAPVGDPLSAEALSIGQALDVNSAAMARLLLTRGSCHLMWGRGVQAVLYYREAARLAEDISDSNILANALVLLADVLSITDPTAAAEAARASVRHLRQTGARHWLAYAVSNLVQVLLMLGQWDEATEELSQAVGEDMLGEVELLRCVQGWLVAMRGDTATARAVLEETRDMEASEHWQSRTMFALVAAFVAIAEGRTADALQLATSAVTSVAETRITAETVRWGWPLAARAALDLGDMGAAAELLAMVDAHRPGHVAPMLRAERQLVRARLAAINERPSAAAEFEAAIESIRKQGTPFHLAHGLLDMAAHRLQLGGMDDADAHLSAAVAEAREIAGQLGCRPLLDRADALDALLQQAPA